MCALSGARWAAWSGAAHNGDQVARSVLVLWRLHRPLPVSKQTARTPVCFPDCENRCHVLGDYRWQAGIFVAISRSDTTFRRSRSSTNTMYPDELV